MIHVGIDPGVSGAVVVIDRGGLYVHDPVLYTKRGKNRISPYWALELFKALGNTEVSVLIEEQWPRPGEGTLGAFTAGYNLCVYEVAARAHGAKIDYVLPQAWKKHYGLLFPAGTHLKAVKTASRVKAADLFPASADFFRRVKDDGRAEAALIAWWGKQTIK